MPEEPDNLNRPNDALSLALLKLEPAQTGLDRDRLMFEAGAASRTAALRLWQATAGFLAAMGFAAGLLFHKPTIVERPVYLEKQSQTISPAQP